MTFTRYVGKNGERRLIVPQADLTWSDAAKLAHAILLAVGEDSAEAAYSRADEAVRAQVAVQIEALAKAVRK